MIGCQKIIKLLSRSIKKNKIAQAYIFSGPEGVGKFTLAKKFAKSLISEMDFKPASKDLKNKKFLSDLIILNPEVKEKKGVTKEREIKIEKIRNVQKEMSLYPSQGNYRILIINNAHKMNKASQNALLKTIEEPNETSIIILVTHKEGALLPTVKSRCQKVRFNLVADEEIKKLLDDSRLLSGNPITKNSKEKIISLSAGRPGWAVKMARDKKELYWRENALEELKKISAMNIAQRLEMAEKFSKNIPETIKKLEFWTWILYSQVKKNVSQAPQFFKIIEKIDRSADELRKTNASGRLILENLIINL